MIEAFGITDAGRVRTSNEDSLLVSDELGLFAVSDGMGGHQAGEVASRLAVETLEAFVRRSANDAEITWPLGLDPGFSVRANRLRTGILLANRRVVDAAATRPELSGMGATLTAVLADGDQFAFGHVGDSRLYLVADGSLTQLTKDDSWVATLAAAAKLGPEEIARHPMRHVLTNVLGARPEIRIQLAERVLHDGDLLVACSDGLSGAVNDDTLHGLLSAAADERLEARAHRLLQAALDNGGRDNITAVLMRYTER